MKEFKTIGSRLYWAYANMGRADAALKESAKSFSKTHHMIRAKLFKGLSEGNMSISSVLKDEQLKYISPGTCCYCGSKENISIDHLIPKHNGGPDSADNMVFACKHCNSSKGSSDLIVWYANKRKEFPPILLLRRYLKLAIMITKDRNLLDHPIDKVTEISPPLPYCVETIPVKLPPLKDLKLWISDI